MALPMTESGYVFAPLLWQPPWRPSYDFKLPPVSEIDPEILKLAQQIAEQEPSSLSDDEQVAIMSDFIMGEDKQWSESP